MSEIVEDHENEIIVEYESDDFEEFLHDLSEATTRADAQRQNALESTHENPADHQKEESKAWS
jgi:hypothetical protein